MKNAKKTKNERPKKIKKMGKGQSKSLSRHSAASSSSSSSSSASSSAASSSPPSSSSSASSNFEKCRKVKLEIHSIRGGTMVQLSKVSCFDESGDLIQFQSAKNPNGRNPRNEEPSKAIDGEIATKWLDYGESRPYVLILEASNPFNLCHYELTTANDCS